MEFLSADRFVMTTVTICNYFSGFVSWENATNQFTFVFSVVNRFKPLPVVKVLVYPFMRTVCWSLLLSFLLHT